MLTPLSQSRRGPGAVSNPCRSQPHATDTVSTPVGGGASAGNASLSAGRLGRLLPDRALPRPQEDSQTPGKEHTQDITVQVI